MGTDIHDGTMLVVRIAGPAGGDRARWQFTFPSGSDQVTLRRDEVVVLAAKLAHSAALPRPEDRHAETDADRHAEDVWHARYDGEADRV